MHVGGVLCANLARYSIVNAPEYIYYIIYIMAIILYATVIHGLFFIKIKLYTSYS